MTVYIGSGAGFAGDRLDAGVAVVETLKDRDGPRYLIFEVMGERTLAIAQRIKMRKPELGYSPYLEPYLRNVLAAAKQHGVTIVANLGNANPLGGARRTHELAKELGVEGLRVAVVLGDDLLAFMDADEIAGLPAVEGISIDGKEIIAANAYLGARPVAEALKLGVDVVLVGRTTDAALVLGPLIHEYGWEAEDWDLLAAGTLAGHLLECGGQVTGGYFCDPGFKDVPGMDELGFPIGEIEADGSIVITKADNTGGLVTKATVTEQMLYEVHDPSAYLTPDVSLDITNVTLEDDGKDRVRIIGARGAPPPETLKVTISADGGWLAESEMIYAGPNALARARLAADVVRSRVAKHGVIEPVRIEIIGTGAVFDNDGAERERAKNMPMDGEYRLRAAIRTLDKATAQYVNDEVLSLFCSGPAGGGGYRCNITGQVNTASVLVPRGPVEAQARAEEVHP
ncbi:acyclic terpene utilization AtuA family protein [Thalassospiraceae bacterium LMO-JJ14]|nr:acyclic terpene utilization AtuA family protein [Thalassospiraceae bacterium LMO-JJ14]